MTVDQVGNMFALKPGQRSDVAPIAIGSHLDTQPTGGKFDGVLGVLGGLEVMRTLHDLGYETNAPLMLVNWTNEEGSRFAPAMLGSGVYAGVFDRAFADSRRGSPGRRPSRRPSRASAIAARPRPARSSSAPCSNCISSRGRSSRPSRRSIGVVTGVQGMRWYEIELTGREAHTGSTPMHLRKNALLGAARIVEQVDRIALEHAPSAVGTVGLVEVTPNSRNVIPGHVFFTVDFRHPDDAVLDVMERELLEAVPAVAAEIGLEHDVKKVWDSPAVRFDPDCIAAVRTGIEKAGLPARDMVSGAGHDAAYIARVAPTTMIFVPCAGGLSHNEAESTTFEECSAEPRFCSTPSWNTISASV